MNTLLTKLKTDGHVAIGSFIFLTGTVVHLTHGLDASYVAFTTTVLGFLGGHAWVQSQGSGQ
jgi:hypothetical protein